MNKIELLIGRACFHTGCKCCRKATPLLNTLGGDFSFYFCIENQYNNQDGCAKWTSHPSPTTTTTDMLLICVSQHSFDKQDTNY